MAALREAVLRVPDDVTGLLESIDVMSDSLEAVTEELSGERTRAPRGPSLMSRLSRSQGSWYGTVNEVTGLQHRQYQIASGAFPAIRARIVVLLERMLPALESRAEEAGAPWTSGRRVPTIR